MHKDDEIFPHKLIEDLKYDVEALKKKLSAPDSTAQDLIVEMEDLKSSIKELNNVFREALEDIKEEDSSKLLQSLQNKVESVTTQNETIARGMIAISDKLEDFMKRNQPGHPIVSPQPRPVSPSRMAPPPSPPMPPKPRRSGIFK